MFLIASVTLLTAILVLQFRFVKRERKVTSESWGSLLDQIERLDVGRLHEIADCYLQPDGHQLRIEPGEMWETLGGMAGLQIMLHNAQVMVDLAMYAERWSDENGRVVSEFLRRDAARLRKAVRRIHYKVFTGRGLFYIGFELQQAIADYWLMRARLLGMYSECHAGLLPRLAEAV